LTQHVKHMQTDNVNMPVSKFAYSKC